MEDVQVIMDNCNQVTRLTHDILQLTRIRPDDVHFSQVNLSDLVTQVFNYVKQDVKDRSCKLILTPNQYVKADINMLRIAITNLIQNAWKYTSKVDRPIIEFGVLTENSTKVYFIKDNGAGFDSDSTKKVFEAFIRCHTSDEFPGTGIGLATVKKVFDIHHAQVWIKSKPNEGATVYFSFQ